MATLMTADVARKISDVRYVVTARLAIVPDENQGQVYLMQDALVPTNLPESIIQHLLDSHVISPVAA